MCDEFGAFRGVSGPTRARGLRHTAAFVWLAATMAGWQRCSVCRRRVPPEDYRADMRCRGTPCSAALSPPAAAFSGCGRAPQPEKAVFDFRPTFVTLRP